MNYDLESIVIKIDTDASGNLKIPVAGCNENFVQNFPYDWQVSYDDGEFVRYQGTGGAKGIIIASGLGAGTNHTVVIKPTTEAYGWAKAFGFLDSGIADLLTEIIWDKTHMGYALSATNTGAGFRVAQYYGCPRITYVPEEYMPDTVTTIGNYFRYCQYQSAFGITTLTPEVLSNQVVTIGTYFRSYQYSGESGITMSIMDVVDEVMPDTVTTIGNSFREYMYRNCPLIIRPANEVLSNSVTTIGNNFRRSQYLGCLSLSKPADEFLPNSVTTIGNYFRRQQYQETGITKTTKENMPDSIISVGTDCRYNQYYNISTLKEIVGEANPKNATIGNNYRRSQYYQCPNLVKARLQAKGSSTNYSNGCLTGCGSPENPITVTILGNIVDAVSADSRGLANTNVDKIYVNADLVDSYKSSSAWSNITDSKFVAIPSVSANTEILLDYGGGKDRQNIKTGVVEKITINRILNGTENWTRDSANNRVTLALSDSSSGEYSSVICTHGIAHTSSAGTTRDDGWCTFPGLLACYTTKASLQDFKDWLAQEYADGTPVIVIHCKASYNPTQVEPQDVNTRNGENLFEITQAGTDVNNLQIDITAETSAGGYTANMFNGEDYSVESNWIEISEQDEDEGGDVVGPNSSTDGNVALFDGTTGKLIKDSGVNLSSKQDILTAGNGIDINASNKISTTYYYGGSSTAAATVQKEVSIPGITELNVGQVIVVKPTETSTVASSTLKLNNFDAYAMIYNGNSITTSTDSIVWAANVPSMFLFDTLNDTYCWRFLGHGLDNNTTYTINYLYDAGRYTVGTGNYAVTRYSLVMMKPDGTWEKITATNANYSTGTTKNVNTNGFVLNQIRYYNTTAVLANGALAATNVFSAQAASVQGRYSFNCGTEPGWSEGDVIYLVGSIGVDGLFYLDTTKWWDTQLPSTKDGKLYIRLGMALTSTDSTFSFLQDRPIFYYDNGIRAYLAADNKQDVISDLATIRSGAALGATALQPGDNISVLSNDAGYLTSSTGVTSVNGNTGAVTVTDTTYTAGTGIEIKNGGGYPDMQGPAPTGFHVPSDTEWQEVLDMLSTVYGSVTSAIIEEELKMPFAGARIPSTGQVVDVGSVGIYWTSNCNESNNEPITLDLYESQIGVIGARFGLSIRAFKNTPVIPDSNWTPLYQGTGNAGIYRNSTDGLISISSDGVKWTTMQDKNLGATTVYNQGDGLTDANCGNFYQWGNNYGFPHSGNITTSSTLVDASGYGPGNYYSSSTFITVTSSDFRSTTPNINLWGGVTGAVEYNNAITNTGVLSVNGQTGDVTIESGGIQNDTTGTTTTLNSIRTGNETEYANVTKVVGVEYHVYPN